MTRTLNLHVLISAILIAITSGDGSSKVTIKTAWTGGTHSEGPHWSATENALYWVDIVAQNVHRLDPCTNNVISRHIEYGQVTPIIPIKGAPGKVVIGVRAEIYTFDFNLNSTTGDDGLRLITAMDFGKPDNRANDGKCDVKGRFWVGTMGDQDDVGNVNPDQGALYLIKSDDVVHPQAKILPLSIPNGMAWSKDNKRFFHTDSATHKVDAWDFVLENGLIQNRSTVFDLIANNLPGIPDGLTIDTDDNLWIALFNAGKVIKVDSRSGQLLQQYELPASKVTSAAWGGPDLDTLYVTSARDQLTAQQLEAQPLAGSIFAIEGTGSRGLPANEFLFDPNY